MSTENQDNQTVARGSWLYAGIVECDIRIVRRNRRYEVGEHFSQINWLKFETGTFFYLQSGSTTQRGVYPDYGQCLCSPEEAMSRAYELTQGTVYWLLPEAIKVSIEDTVRAITYDDIIKAFRKKRLGCEPDTDMVTEAISRIYKWAVRTELEARTSMHTDDHLMHRQAMIRELLQYLEPRQPYSGGFSAGSSPHGPRK